MAFCRMRVVAAEDGAVAGQQELGVVACNALQRLQKLRDVRAVMGVDDADAAVLVDVVAAEEEIAELEARAGPPCGRACARPSGLRSPTLITSPSLSSTSTLQRGIGMSKFWALIVAKVRISSPVSIGSTDLRMGGDLGLEQLAGVGRSLDVVGVGVRGDEHLAGGQVEIHLPDQLDDLVDACRDSRCRSSSELAAAVDEIDVDAQAPAGLVVHLDDVGKEIFPGQHGGRLERRELQVA